LPEQRDLRRAVPDGAAAIAVRGSTIVHRRSVFLAAALLLALGLGTPAASPSGSPKASLDVTLAPKPVVSGGTTALASARFANEGAGRFTQVKLTFDIPAGSFEFASPTSGCVASGTQVTCELGKVRGGEQVEQFVAFTAPAGAGATEVVARATFREDRGASILDSDETGVAPAGDPNRLGTCSSEAGTLATEPASGAGNPQSTSVEFTESVVLPCTPISVGEQDRTAANPGCPPGETCTTQVSFVTVPALPEPAVVTIVFDREILPRGTKPKNFVLWETPDKYPAQPIRQVQPCPLPAGEDSCIVEVTKHRKKGIQVVLEVTGTGEDPRFAG
jgi:hypothetical protein